MAYMKHTIFPTSEKDARQIMYHAFERGWNDKKWGFVERVLAKAFMADFFSSRPKNEWVKLGEALENVEFKNLNVDDVEKRVDQAFNRMVRAGYLLSYNKRGKRYYEINFDSKERQKGMG